MEKVYDNLKICGFFIRSYIFSLIKAYPFSLPSERGVSAYRKILICRIRISTS